MVLSKKLSMVTMHCILFIANFCSRTFATVIIDAAFLSHMLRYSVLLKIKIFIICWLSEVSELMYYFVLRLVLTCFDMNTHIWAWKPFLTQISNILLLLTFIKPGVELNPLMSAYGTKHSLSKQMWRIKRQLIIHSYLSLQLICHSTFMVLFSSYHYGL